MDAGAVVAPTTRMISYSLAANANSRSSASSPQLRGPAMIRGWSFAKGGAIQSSQGIGLGIAPSAITETNVANTTALPFRPLIDAVTGVGGAAQAPNSTTRFLDTQAGVDIEVDGISYIILESSFFLVAYISAGALGGDGFHGYVHLLEQVNPQALANFL